jgi:hypothetical protein
MTVITATLMCPVSSALSQPAGQRPDALKTFTNALERDGFDVNTGATAAINVVAAWCAGTTIPGFPFDHALYSNNQPYLGLRVPISAQEPGKLTGPFKLGPEEAIVLIGLTPPPERYFGFYPFLKTKVNPDGVRQPLWATLGDAVNNATVKTTGPTPFNSPVALIFTPDQGTDARVRAALRHAGYPAAIINTVVFPASMLNLGHDENADELFIVMRNAIWLKEADGDSYIQNPPLHVFRVTPRTPAIAKPFPAPPLRVRGTGQTEMNLMNKLGQLRQGIIAANPGLHATDIQTRPNFYEGYDYIQRGLDPWGDSRDALFLTAGYLPEFGSTNEVTLADDEFLVVYGVNHVATAKATYMSVNVYASETAKVPIGGLDDRDFPNTATPYLPSGDPAADVMYAYRISRNCAAGEANCKQLSAPEGCTRLTIDSSTVLGIIFRAYLEPATGVGPAMQEILYDRVIKFSPRP